MNAAGRSDDDALERLLERVYREQHHDFRGYARASIQRGVARALAALELSSVEELLLRLGGERAPFGTLLSALTVQVSELFRDPDYFLVMREQVIPRIATYPSPRIWVAGCGTGEEAYSFAVLLREAGLLSRARVYATDIDAGSLAVARAGSYVVPDVATLEARSRRAGVTALWDHARVTASHVTFDDALRSRIVFSEHSLATDSVFVEAQLVSCRNVLLYFEGDLRGRALTLLHDSLCPRGFLGLGASESLSTSAAEAAFAPFAATTRVYRRRS